MPQTGITFKDQGIGTMLAQLEKYSKSGADKTMVTMRNLGTRHLNRLYDLLYSDSRGGEYQRTRKLRSETSISLRAIANGKSLFIISGAPYSAFVEFGTYASARSPDSIYSRAVAAARNSDIDDIVYLEYGKSSIGLEPRPIVYPTLAYLAAILPGVIYAQLIQDVAALN